MKQRYLDEIQSNQNITAEMTKIPEKYIEKPNIFYNSITEKDPAKSKQEEHDTLDAKSEHKLFTLMTRKNFRMKA